MPRLDSQGREAIASRSEVATPRRVFLHLAACVALALAAALSEAFCLGARQRTGVRAIEIQLDLERIVEQIRILCGWFLRARPRPRYSRREALLILEYKERYGLSAAGIARDFLVSLATVYRWTKRRRTSPACSNARLNAAKPVPPCPRIGDDRRSFVREMAVTGFGGDRTIARHLRLQGERISPRSVGRFRQNPLAQDNRPKRPAQRPSIEPPQLIDACAGHLAGPRRFPRPRVARLLRGMVEALTEGIASDALARTDDESGSDYGAEHALLRSRRAEQLAILLSRFSRIAPRKRPHYTDAERANILAFKYRFRLSNVTLAQWFLLDPGTLSDWNRDVDRPGERKRPLVAPITDTQSAISSVAADLRFVPKRLTQAVAQTLGALAAKVPVRKQGTRRDKPRSRPARTPSARNRVPIQARYPDHYWSSDLTTFELGRQFYLASILDLFSRDILAWELFAGQPTSEQMSVLFQEAVAGHGKPKHFVSDQGGQFLGEAFGAALAAHGIGHRIGAVGQHGSIALIERLWRSVKHCLDMKTVRPNVAEVLYDRIAVIIDFYRTKRPHMALGDAAPAEVYSGETSRAWSSKPAPRGWRGEACAPPPFRIRHGFPHDCKLPYLERIA